MNFWNQQPQLPPSNLNEIIKGMVRADEQKGPVLNKIILTLVVLAIIVVPIIILVFHLF